jgi:hypothetical protein
MANSGRLSNEPTRASREPSSAPRQDGDVPDTNTDASMPNAPHEMATSTFPAVNARAVSENAALSDGRPTPPTAASTHNSGSPAAATSLLPPANASNAQQAQSAMDDLDGAVDNATYGTRSRNRTANARPNYAEDQDMDFEFTSAATTTKKKAAQQDGLAPLPSIEAKRADDLTRVMGGSSKETTPVAGNAATTSKKRKAASSLPQQAQTPPASIVPPPSAAVRKSTTLPASAMARETNVMTFSKHRNCLNKKGELIADDGTKLAVNGKPNPSASFSRLQPPTPPAFLFQKKRNCFRRLANGFGYRSRVPCM